VSRVHGDVVRSFESIRRARIASAAGRRRAVQPNSPRIPRVRRAAPVSVRTALRRVVYGTEVTCRARGADGGCSSASGARIRERSSSTGVRRPNVGSVCSREPGNDATQCCRMPLCSGRRRCVRPLGAPPASSPAGSTPVPPEESGE
jgi:hypothetical protein